MLFLFTRPNITTQIKADKTSQKNFIEGEKMEETSVISTEEGLLFQG